MQRRIIAAMIGFLVGMGLALSSHAGPKYHMEMGNINLTDGNKQYLSEHGWLAPVFSDLPSGIFVHFNKGLLAAPMKSIDFQLQVSPETTASVEGACMERIERVRVQLQEQGAQVMSGTCLPLNKAGGIDQTVSVGQVIYMLNHLQ